MLDNIVESCVENAQKLIDHFDRTHIVNLVSRSDRRKETIEEFRKYGMSIGDNRCDFFPAVKPESANEFPNIGTRGCFLSHLAIIEDAIQKEYGNILILEDDIFFSRKINQYIESALQQLEELDWDIAYFGHPLTDDRKNPHWKILDEPMMMSHFYALNAKTFTHLAQLLKDIEGRPINHPEGGAMHYDGALNFYRSRYPQVKAYYFSKNLGWQRPSKTDVHPNGFLDKSPLLKPVVNTLRSIKKRFAKEYRF